MSHAQEISALWDDLRKAAEIIEALRNDQRRLEGERSAAEERCQLLAIHHQDRLEHTRLEYRKQMGDDAEAWQRHVKHITDNLAEREAENVRQNDDFLSTSLKQEANHTPTLTPSRHCVSPLKTVRGCCLGDARQRSFVTTSLLC